MFLARVAHMATITARESYADRNYDNPDAHVLRDANNFIHRVTGYIMSALTHSEMAGQDESMMRMIEGYYRDRGLTSYLLKWLETPSRDANQ